MSWKLSGLVKSLTHTPSGKKLSSSEKLFLLILADYSDEDTGICWPSIERLARECLCCERTVQYMIKSLTKAGCIEVTKRTGNSSHYKLTVSRGGANSAPVQQLLREGGAIAIAPKPSLEPSDTKNKRVLLSQLPDWLPVNLWNDYLQMRLRIKKPLVTTKGLSLAINRIDKFRQEGHSPESVLEWSILNSYQGLYPPREETAVRGNRATVGSRREVSTEQYEENLRIIKELSK